MGQEKAILSYRLRIIFRILTAWATGSHMRQSRALELWGYVSHLERVKKTVGNIWAVNAVIFSGKLAPFSPPVLFFFLSLFIFLHHTFSSLSLSLSISFCDSLCVSFLFFSLFFTLFFACLALFLNYTHTTRRVCEAGFEGRTASEAE